MCTCFNVSVRWRKKLFFSTLYLSFFLLFLIFFHFTFFLFLVYSENVQSGLHTTWKISILRKTWSIIIRKWNFSIIDFLYPFLSFHTPRSFVFCIFILYRIVCALNDSFFFLSNTNVPILQRQVSIRQSLFSIIRSNHDRFVYFVRFLEYRETTEVTATRGAKTAALSFKIFIG